MNIPPETAIMGLALLDLMEQCHREGDMNPYQDSFDAFRSSWLSSEFDEWELVEGALVEVRAAIQRGRPFDDKGLRARLMKATVPPCQADVGETERDGTKLWCSSIDSEDEEVYGPFDTREEAIEAARARRDACKFDDTECTVGHCEYADPGWHLNDSQIDFMIESLDRCAHDNMYHWVYGQIFDWRTSDSEESFTRELRSLLRKHVKSKYFLMAMDGREKVTLPPNVDDPQRKLCERMSDKAGLTSDQIERINAILDEEK